MHTVVFLLKNVFVFCFFCFKTKILKENFRVSLEDFLFRRFPIVPLHSLIIILDWLYIFISIFTLDFFFHHHCNESASGRVFSVVCTSVEIIRLSKNWVSLTRPWAHSQYPPAVYRWMQGVVHRLPGSCGYWQASRRDGKFQCWNWPAFNTAVFLYALWVEWGMSCA